MPEIISYVVGLMDNIVITLSSLPSAAKGGVAVFDDIVLQDIETGAVIFHEDFVGITDKIFYYLSNF